MGDSYYNIMTGETLDELSHHGILGQKWGVRRYQNRDGSLTAAGKKRVGLIGNIKDQHRRKKIQKKRKESLEKARKAKKEKELREEAKRKALKKGSATELLKFRGDITDEEYAQVLSRLRNEGALRDLAAKEQEGKKSKIEKAISAVNNVGSLIDSGIKIYDKGSSFMKKLDNAEKEEKKKIQEKEAKEKQKEAIKKLVKVAGQNQETQGSKVLNNLSRFINETPYDDIDFEYVKKVYTKASNLDVVERNANQRKINKAILDVIDTASPETLDFVLDYAAGVNRNTNYSLTNFVGDKKDEKKEGNNKK